MGSRRADRPGPPQGIVVTAPGRKPWKSQGTVAEAATLRTGRLDPDLPPTAAPAIAAPPPLVSVAVETPPVPPVAEAVRGRSWQRPVGIAAAGLGAVGIGIGAALGVAAKGKWNDSTRPGNLAYCDSSNVCGPTGMSMRNTVYGLASGATAAFVVGSVLVGGGALVFFTAPRSSARVGFAPNGLWMEGTW